MENWDSQRKSVYEGSVAQVSLAPAVAEGEWLWVMPGGLK